MIKRSSDILWMLRINSFVEEKTMTSSSKQAPLDFFDK
jgi:hypothetical protein